VPAVLTAAEALKCPAGQALEDVEGKGPGVRCNIAHTTLNRHNDSRSLQAFCAGCYEDCPIFRRNRRAFYDDAHRGLGRELRRDTPRSER
jgi:hypothetical protein